MVQLYVDDDIRPLSDFRAEMASVVRKVSETGRPTVLTQRGRGVAVLVGVSEYQQMQERLELLEDIYTAEAQVEAGEGVAHDDAKRRLLASLAE